MAMGVPLHERDAVPVLEIRPSLDTTILPSADTTEEMRPSLDTTSDKTTENLPSADTTSDSSPRGGALTSGLVQGRVQRGEDLTTSDSSRGAALAAIVTVDAEGAWKGHVARSLTHESSGGAGMTPLVVRIERV
ncbi:hypothetical protein T484DRAFT_1880851 [Baffinella frigidus]|nr:hypothetical protein T484DRAFT_1880851 [Cryptophyta sp. CCMP2293]